MSRWFFYRFLPWLEGPVGTLVFIGVALLLLLVAPLLLLSAMCWVMDTKCDVWP